MSETQEQSSLGHMPGDKWEFDAEVTACFDDMLNRSIPQYGVMRKAVFDLGTRFVHPGDTIVDLGCSTGEALEPYVTRYGASCKYVGVETSIPMVTAAMERFKGRASSDMYGDSQGVSVEIVRMDLRDTYPVNMAKLTMSVLTMMFIPIEYRQRVIDQAYNHTLPGGAFIVVEKLLGSGGDINTMMIDIYHEMKRNKGYSSEEVERKRMSLQGVLVPQTASSNTLMLASAGFRSIDCFWRWMNFGAFVAIKGE